MIMDLPEANINFKGVKGCISQSEDHQIVFFEIEPIGKVAEHSHNAQWGIVIEGEMELTIGGLTKTLQSFVPETCPNDFGRVGIPVEETLRNLRLPNSPGFAYIKTN